jgi:RNA polymerase sigma-70 factor, ECF subfamily
MEAYHNRGAKTTDEQLLKALGADDRDAWGELASRYLRPVAAYINKAIMDADLAEDLAQKTFLLLWERRAEYAMSNYAQRVLFGLAKHTSYFARMQRLKWESRFTPLDTIDHSENPHAIPVIDKRPPITELIVRQEQIQLVKDALAALPENIRELVTFLYVDNRPIAETAKRCGLRIHTARALAELAMEFITAKVEGREPSESVACAIKALRGEKVTLTKAPKVPRQHIIHAQAAERWEAVREHFYTTGRDIKKTTAHFGLCKSTVYYMIRQTRLFRRGLRTIH